jgi:SAM-dependent methyltransferase
VAGTERVSVRVAPAEATGLPAGTFDTVMVRHVLAHNGGREQAIVDHLATLLRPGGCLYLVDAYGRGMTTEPDLPVLAESNERYRAFHALRGNDLRAGLQLGDWVRAAGLEPVDFRGTYQIVTFPPGLRPPALAARDAMLAAGVVTAADLERWERELAALDASPDRPTGFMPIFTAIGRAAAA